MVIMQKFKKAEIKGCKNIGMQELKNAKMQNCNNARIQE